ncbi:juvenile hormone epoxide hydrolase 2-like [Onthophagus taurus]|uniref:juvenile hormone epoxide hydrolase 2-like n=1 Tax=Onthophagus taurus TaxID=166361 RepID=UPI000C2023BE|nr:juvenile hormone epoxide hydrolase 2-like [Onthophagus taurus]
MALTLKLFVIIFITVLSAVYIRKNFDHFFDVSIPTLEEIWWGPKSIKADNKIRSFKIDVSEDVIKDLKYRLENARPFTPPLEGIQQQYGMNTKLLSDVVNFWKTDYNWKEREEFLNKYPQFITNIQGLDIHFIHVKPKNIPSGVKILPLLMLHGWPGSIREFYEIIPFLTELNEYNKKSKIIFEVIAPSLPGYGFSKGAIRPGMGPAEIGVVMKNLMLRLGFDKYYLQGGDWGANIVAHMSALFPNHILGTHSNMCLAMTPGSFIKYLLTLITPSWLIKETEKVIMTPFEIFELGLLETGYFHVQATKPDTIGVSLDDSPVGLAAYMLEKFTTGTLIDYKNREDGGLKIKFTYTNLLDNVMIYWVNKSMTTAARLYSEGFNKNQFKRGLERTPVTVPYACAKFLNDMHMPDSFLTTRFKNLIHSKTYEGGHFAAMEVPKTLAADIYMALEKIENLQSNNNTEK